MGAWGHLAFDNDDAGDWKDGLEEVDDFSLVDEAFAAVEETEDYLEAPEACAAVAACEVLARASGRPGYHNASTESVDAWVKEHKLTPPPKLLKRAKLVLDRVLGEESELRQLWEETPDHKAWLDAMADLRKRLGS